MLIPARGAKFIYLFRTSFFGIILWMISNDIFNSSHSDDSYKSVFSVAHEWGQSSDGVRKLFIKPSLTALKWIYWFNPDSKKLYNVTKDAFGHVKTIFSWTDLPTDAHNFAGKVFLLKESIEQRSLWNTLVNTSKVSEYGFAFSDLFLGNLNPLASSKKIYFSYNYANTLSIFGLFENLAYLITSVDRFFLEFKHVLHSSKEDPKYTLAWIKIIKKLPTFILSLGGIAFFFLEICFIPKLLYLVFSTIHMILQIAAHFFKELHRSSTKNSGDNFIAFLP